MGACCTGKEFRQDNKMEEIYVKHLRQTFTTEAKFSLEPKIEIECEKTSLSDTISRLMRKNSEINSSAVIAMNRFYFEQLWNITKFHLDDFTKSDYVLLDLRKLRKENFLKKFKQINYTDEQIANLNASQYVRFRKYIEFKHVIVLLNGDETESLDGLIKYFASMNISATLNILDLVLNEENLTNNNKNIYKYIDTNLKDYPYILIPLKYFPHLNSDNLIFFDFTNGDITNYINRLTTKHNDLNSFHGQFNIATIVYLSSHKKEEEISEGKVKLMNGINCKVFQLNDITNLKDNKTLYSIINTIKFEILTNKSVLIVADNDLDATLIKSYLLLFIWKITEVDPLIINNFLKEGMIYLRTNDEKKLVDFMNKFAYQKTNLLCPSDDLDFHNKSFKEQIQLLLVKLKDETSSDVFKQFTSMIQKITYNIINNPGNEMYYLIKKDSKSVRNYIEHNNHSLEIFKLFGFESILNEGVPSYYLDINISIEELKVKHNQFNEIVSLYK